MCFHQAQCRGRRVPLRGSQQGTQARRGDGGAARAPVRVTTTIGGSQPEAGV